MSEQVAQAERAHVVYKVDGKAKDEKSMEELLVRVKRDANEARQKLMEWLQGIDPNGKVTSVNMGIVQTSYVEATLEAVKKLVNKETMPDMVEAAVHLDS